MASEKLSVVSLFTGAGGLDLGFEAAGFETRVAVEMDADAVKTLRENRSDWHVIPNDIHSEAASSAAILKAGRLSATEPDILIGGPPCQPFSKSGYWATGDAKRLADPRAGTLGAFLRVLEDIQPRAYLLENVPGLAFSSKDEGLVFLRRSIEEINKRKKVEYSFSPALLRATEYGVPQERQRVFIIGHRGGKSFVFPEATHRQASVDEFGLSLAQHLKPLTTAWDAIGDLEDDDDPALRVTGKWADLLPSIPEGMNYLFHTPRGGGKPLFGWRTRYWSFLLKLCKRVPSWTIAAQPGPAIGPFHWKNRRLSEHELRRLQTFPDDYRVLGSLRAIQKQLGNAVPSALAEVLALSIRAQFFDAAAGTQEPTLVPKSRGEPPPAELPVNVPAKYLELAAAHAEHPGTGLGPGAQARRLARSE
jgi:DNA (cytosine-5)-methyltransferase 1